MIKEQKKNMVGFKKGHIPHNKGKKIEVNHD